MNLIVWLRFFCFFLFFFQSEDSLSSDVHLGLYDEVQRVLATKYSARSTVEHCTMKRNPAYSVFDSKSTTTITASTKI